MSDSEQLAAAIRDVRQGLAKLETQAPNRDVAVGLATAEAFLDRETPRLLAAARISGDPQTAGPGIKWWTLADVVHDRNESIAEIGGRCNHDESPPECIADAQRTAAEYNRRLAARVSGDPQTGLREALGKIAAVQPSEFTDVHRLVRIARTALAAIPADPADWTALANDIRIVDGNHDLGAGELASRLVERGWRKAAGDPAGLREALDDLIRDGEALVGVIGAAPAECRREDGESPADDVCALHAAEWSTRNGQDLGHCEWIEARMASLPNWHSSVAAEYARLAPRAPRMTRFLLGLAVGATAVYVAVFGWGWLGR